MHLWGTSEIIFLLVWPRALGPSVHLSSTEFSFQNSGFFGIHLNSQMQKSLQKINISHILNPNLNKEIPLNRAHQDLSYNNTKGTFQFLRNFQATI
jgi:hypothetical protein